MNPNDKTSQDTEKKSDETVKREFFREIFGDPEITIPSLTGEQLKFIRDHLKFTQEQMAFLLGISLRRVNDLESKGMEPLKPILSALLYIYLRVGRRGIALLFNRRLYPKVDVSAAPGSDESPEQAEARRKSEIEHLGIRDVTAKPGESSPKLKDELTGDRIREVRRQWTLTQAQLGKVLFVKARTVSNWEKGRTAPDQATIEMLQMLKDAKSSEDLPSEMRARYELIRETSGLSRPRFNRKRS
ncbi:DNA-binding transcriptional regulator [Sutterella sp.]|uniref:helix-turn-helix domain-containing protein n=1 Tax=Sutterella sp. TaxID=1981025 RepID=UPI0026DECE1F|nr:helix-turn-helix domain-containing protein [Sutterella sp.]MDO5532261.1 helix-turn-helix domain-containing protein [Sutterella sp.]